MWPRELTIVSSLNRSVALGSTFANLLNQFEDRRLLLAGFSLGGQIILSSLAQLECQIASDPNPKHLGSYRVALITPALEANDALNSVGPLPTNPLVSQTVVFINRRDIAIRAASLATRKTSAPPAVTLEQVAQQPACGTTNPVALKTSPIRFRACIRLQGTQLVRKNCNR